MPGHGRMNKNGHFRASHLQQACIYEMVHFPLHRYTRVLGRISLGWSKMEFLMAQNPQLPISSPMFILIQMFVDITEYLHLQPLS